MLAEGVKNGSADSCQTQQHEHHALHAEERAERAVNKRNTGQNGQPGEQHYHAFDLTLGNGAGLQSVRCPAALVGIRAFLRIAQLVAQIAQNLQTQRRADSERKNN